MQYDPERNDWPMGLITATLIGIFVGIFIGAAALIVIWAMNS